MHGKILYLSNISIYGTLFHILAREAPFVNREWDCFMIWTKKRCVYPLVNNGLMRIGIPIALFLGYLSAFNYDNISHYLYQILQTRRSLK